MMYHKSTRKKVIQTKKPRAQARSPFGITNNVSRSTSSLIPEPYPHKLYVDCLKYTKRENIDDVINIMSKKVFVPKQWLYYYKKFKFMQGVNARRALLKLAQIGTLYSLVRGKYYYTPRDTIIPGIEDVPDDDNDEEPIEDESTNEKLTHQKSIPNNDNTNDDDDEDDNDDELDETIEWTLPEWEDEKGPQLVDVQTVLFKRHHLYESVQHTTLIRFEKTDSPLLKSKPSIPVSTTMQVLFGECLDIALFLKKSDRCKPLVIVAGEQSRCSAYLNGGSSQESDMCRRTNLFMCLDDPFVMDKNRTWTYPIPEYGGIYVPHCIVFRENEVNGFAFMKHPQDVSVLACGTYQNPPVEKVTKSSWMDVEWKLSGKIKQDLRRKFECMFEIAVQKGHDAVILSDFGCGRYDSPPKHVAEIMRAVLHEKYANKFKYVVFGIKERRSLDAFKLVFHNGERAPTLEEFGDKISKNIEGDYSRMHYDYGQTDVNAKEVE